MIDTVGSQSALPLAGAPARRFLAPWGYPPTRAPLLTLRTAADAGDLSAQFTLGWIYEHGADVPQDYREAIDWYRRAASHGEPEAINTVGLLYYYGKGVPKDPREATIWFHQAAELGHPEAQWNLAGMYYRGDGAPQDDTQAERWCRRAAEQDCPPAQHSLANIYHDGRGVAADYTEAATWYRRAAAQGFAKAQWNLAELYYVGRGVARNYAIGDVWCRQAAAQGHERAQAHLDVITAPPPPGPFDPPDPPAPTTGGDLFDRVRRNRIRLERGAAEVDAILDRVLPRAHQLDASFDRIDAATRRLDNIIRRAEDLERDHVTRRQGTVQNHPRLEQRGRAGAAPHPSHHGSPENTRYGNPRDRGAPAPDHDRPHRRPRRAIRRGRRRRRGPRAGGPDPTHGAMVTAGRVILEPETKGEPHPCLMTLPTRPASARKPPKPLRR